MPTETVRIEPNMEHRNGPGPRTGMLTAAAVLLILSVSGLHAQQMPAQPNNVRQQLNATAEPKPASPQGAPAAKPASFAKPATPSPGMPSPKPAPAPSPAPAPKPAVKTGTPAEGLGMLSPTAARRDPFSALIGNKDRPGGVPEHLPAGKAGLVVATLRVDGIINGPNGMIAIVSNTQDRVYFLRDGDRLYDGEVKKISMEGISFHQTGKDPFGKPVEREIDKRLYPITSGELQ
jgi:hypothetical protein